MGGVTDAGPELIGTWSAGVEPEDDELALARALLSRLAEPACIPLWGYVRDEGPVEAVRKIRAGTAPADVMRATAARLPAADPEADLAAAQHHGIRLVYPEAPEWPHFGLACLEQAGLRRLAEYRKGRTAAAEHGEPIPPLALWIRGTADLATLGVRSAGIVGARAATAYGERVAADLAFGLAARDFAVVSGGAFGIDAAAHRGALGAGGVTYLVSAGGLDTPYPPANTRLFERCAESGLLIAESPPGAAPRRRRFLTRNRLIAALSSGTVVVEASARSGAINTARHCLRLDRPLMVVPGPVTSALSAGCHDLLRQHEGLARIVTCTDDVVAHIGTLSEAPTGGTHPAAGGYGVRDRLDAVAEPARILFDSFPSRASVGLDYLVAASGLPVATVLQSLSALELAELVERSGDGYRILRRAKGRSDGRGTCSPGRAGA